MHVGGGGGGGGGALPVLQIPLMVMNRVSRIEFTILISLMQSLLLRNLQFGTYWHHQVINKNFGNYFSDKII